MGPERIVVLLVVEYGAMFVALELVGAGETNALRACLNDGIEEPCP